MSDTPKYYIIVTASATDEWTVLNALAAAVNERARDGYTALGAPFRGSSEEYEYTLLQAMVHDQLVIDNKGIHTYRQG